MKTTPLYIIKAPAKINLGLWVLGKRSDGYHELRTVFVKLPNFYDEIHIYPSSRLEVLATLGPSGKSNLVHKAVSLLARYLNRKLNFRIEIKKKIPIGAGLGGGSSDAAAAIKAIIKLLGVNIPFAKLIDIGEKIGSDVPFFLLDSEIAIGRGKGEVLEPVDLTFEAEVRIKCPNISVSTQWAYRELAMRKLYTPEHEAEFRIRKILEMIEHRNIKGLMSHLFNSFEEVVFDFYPAIKLLKENLLKEGAVAALMSGSGSAVFGIFE